MVPIITSETHTEPKIPASEICVCILKLSSPEMTVAFGQSETPENGQSR